MEMIPRALVAGVFAVPRPGPTPPVTADKINRIWGEVSTLAGYRQFQMTPDGSAAQFMGGSPEDAASIQLPLVQVRTSIPLSTDRAGEQVQTVLRTIGRHLDIVEVGNLGIKLVYNAVVPERDARAFVLHRLLQKTDDDLGELRAGGGGLWAGVKYVSGSDQSQYAILIEPLVADNTMLFLDLDVQFPGRASLDDVADRVKEVERYMTGPVNGYLDNA